MFSFTSLVCHEGMSELDSVSSSIADRSASYRFNDWRVTKVTGIGTNNTKHHANIMPMPYWGHCDAGTFNDDNNADIEASGHGICHSAQEQPLLVEDAGINATNRAAQRHPSLLNS